MYKPAYSYANLAEAAIIIPASTITLVKLYQSSKSHFAYLLIAFTLANGLSKLGVFI